MIRSLRAWAFLIAVATFASCDSPGDSVLGLDAEEIDKISIERFDDKLVLEKDGLDWMVATPIRTRANPVTIENLLIVLDQLTIEEHVTSDPQNYDQYGVGESAWVMTVGAGSNSAKILIGRAGRDFETQHIRIDDSEDVLLARGRINTTMRVEVWRYRIIADIDPLAITGATFVTPNGDWRLEKIDEAWTLEGPDGSQPVTPDRVALWASFFNPLSTDRFAAVTRDVVVEYAQRKISLELADGTEHELLFLDLQGEWGIVIDDSDTVFQIFGLRLGNLFPDLLTFE